MSKKLLLALMAPLGALGCECPINATQSMPSYLADMIHQNPSLVYTNLFLASNCSNCMTKFQQQQQQQGNYTIFAPTDDAWIATFNMSTFGGFNNCTGKTEAPTNCLDLLSQDFSLFSPNDLGDCLSIFAAYLTSPGSFVIQNSTQVSNNKSSTHNTSASGNITVLQTLLDSSWLGPDYASNWTNVLVVNTTGSATEMRGGGNSTAKVMKHFPAADGDLYVIDRMLLPPLPLNYTLSFFNTSLSSSLTNLTAFGNETETGSVFCPFDLISRTNAPTAAPEVKDLNSTLIYVPVIFYQNQSQAQTFNLTTFNQKVLHIDVKGNHVALVNGTSLIELANIPLGNGVLHFIANDSTANAKANVNQTHNARASASASASSSSSSASPISSHYSGRPNIYRSAGQR